MQQGGSQYGVSPEMASYTGTGNQPHILDQLQQQLLLQHQQKSGDAAAALAEAASPINSRPPANFDEVHGAGGFPDEDTLAGEDAERGATFGNRWPRQETLALLKIRSEMDATFKDATLKGRLWEDISRKLGELGYHRSAKKCKEKFENVQKYYKRTKEGRAGRQDGKNYRFFSQLEALHSNSNANTTSTTAAITSAVPISVGMTNSNPIVESSSGRIQTPIISAPIVTASERPDLTTTGPSAGVSGSAAAADGISFSSNTSSSSGSEEDEIEEGLNMESRKRKRKELGGCSNKKMMAFSERLIKEVIEKQEGMLQRFLETIEKREQERMIREEAWRRQEMARLTREQEIMAQERAISASRDAAVIAFLQKITGQIIHIVTPVTIPAAAPPQPNPPPTPPTPQRQQQPPQQQQHHQSQSTEIIRQQPQSTEVVLVQQEHQETTGRSFDTTSSRWPKEEVVALIKLRSAIESRYLETGPKGPLWEEISAGMKRLGNNRSAKRCKEKWENINKYFKKVKESSKNRPEDAKTCPYFYQLDELYRKKLLRVGSAGPGNECKQEQEMNLDSDTNAQQGGAVLAILPTPQSRTTTEIENNNNKNGGIINIGGPLQIKTSNGGLPLSFFEEGTVKKPEDIVKGLMGGGHHHNHNQHDHHHHHQQQQAVMDEYDKLEDSDNLDQEEDDGDDEYDDDDNKEDRKMAYKIQYQRPNPGPSNSQGNPAGSFLAMV